MEEKDEKVVRNDSNLNSRQIMMNGQPTLPTNGKGTKRPNGEVNHLPRQDVVYQRNEFFLDSNKRPKYIGIIPTIPSSSFTSHLLPSSHQLKKPFNANALMPNNGTAPLLHQQNNDIMRSASLQGPLTQPHMTSSGYFIQPAVFLPHYQLMPHNYSLPIQHSHPSHPLPQPIKLANDMDVKQKVPQIREPMKGMSLDQLDKQASQLLVTYESQEQNRIDVKEERVNDLSHLLESKDQLIPPHLPPSLPPNSNSDALVKKEGINSGSSEQKPSKINGSISTTISQNQGDSSLELGYLRKEKTRMKRLLSALSSSTVAFNSQVSPPSQLGLFCLESENSVLKEGTVRVLLDRIQEELDLADVKATSFHDNAFPLPLLKRIIQEEQNHLNLNNITTNHIFSNVLAKVGEIFVLELTTRALCEQEASLSSIITLSGEEKEKFRLSREHVAEALRSVDYYDLFLEHF